MHSPATRTRVRWYQYQKGIIRARHKQEVQSTGTTQAITENGTQQGSMATNIAIDGRQQSSQEFQNLPVTKPTCYREEKCTMQKGWSR
jgi:hypothetical protein